MNYHLIENNYEVLEHGYNDKFDINIYYLNDDYCEISVKRIDSSDGWGLLLQLKIFDLDNNNYDIVNFGSSQENSKSLYFKINFKLRLKHYNIKIPNIIYSRKESLLINNYEIEYNSCTEFSDLHIVLYYLEDYKMKIIIRRLDEEHGWNYHLKLVLYDKDINFRKEIIEIGSSEQNYKYLFIDTKIKLFGEDNNYSQEIPKIIFQTGYSDTFKNILHFNSIMTFVELNPEYTYIYYNDIECRKFLRQNFSDEINYSYDSLVPGAFKADLLRYCFLYNNGGCYFDCKQILRVPIRKFLNHNNTLLLCNDVISDALLNAVIFSIPKNEIIEKTIKDCVFNIVNKLGNSPLEVTGPLFFYKSIKNFINNSNLLLQNNRPFDNFNDFCNDYINNNITLIHNNKIILNRFYKGYYNNYLETNHYGKLFNNNEVYYKNFQQLNNLKICIYPNIWNDKFIFKLINDNTLLIKRSDSKDGWHFDLKILIINENYEEKIINIGMCNSNLKEINI